MVNKALAIDPAMINALTNLGVSHEALGHDQQAVDSFQRLRLAKVTKEYDARRVAAGKCLIAMRIGQIMRDPQDLDQAAACMESLGKGAEVPFLPVRAALMRHDPRPSLAYSMKTEGPVETDERRWVAFNMRLEGEMESGANARLAGLLDEYRAVRTKGLAVPEFAKRRAVSLRIDGWPKETQVLLALSRLQEAEALIARTPLDCYECVRIRGLVAEARGDRRGAQLHYLAAARLGPRLPAAFADWGRLLATAGRHGAAEVKLREAVRLAPNWADPLKHWGDMLAAQGKKAEARAKYDAALKLAPNWSALRQARSRVAP